MKLCLVLNERCYSDVMVVFGAHLSNEIMTEDSRFGVLHIYKDAVVLAECDNTGGHVGVLLSSGGLDIHAANKHREKTKGLNKPLFIKSMSKWLFVEKITNASDKTKPKDLVLVGSTDFCNFWSNPYGVDFSFKGI